MSGQSLRKTMASSFVVCCAAAVPCDVAAQDRIIAPDSSISIALPVSYQPLQLNSEALLQFGDSSTESYVMVLVESKEDMYGWNLTRHSLLTVAQVVAGLDLPEVVGPLPLSVSGHPAIQHEMRGASQGTRIAYLHTSVESPEVFAQIVGWTSASRWAANAESLRAITSSVELLGPLGARGTHAADIVPGTWAWETDPELCAGRTQRFVIADDRTSMQIHHSEPIESANGTTTSVTDYVIEGEAPGVLHTYIPGETRTTDDGTPVKWDLVVVGRNRIAWHRADWPEGALTRMLRRCEVASAD